ncbi:MAG: YicC family protein [Bacteroidetes bacterium]|uniref:YicC family protein n=1 Tax=Candidatus Cryptobacteroides faecipullorum TaxID=2840764 RepID=A0A9D9NAT1_9BACT|nr:YicC family protein [Candidatus Cryptobacteroides faecipullorum]
MIKSMTGYGKAETVLESGKISVEIRSLNGKNADISIKTTLLPKDKELLVRQIIADELKRGSIDVFINFEANAAECAKKINQDLVLEYFRQIEEISARIEQEYPGKGICDAESILPSILRMPDVLDMKKTDIINDENWPAVETCIREALERVNEFRSREGETLYRDVTSKVRSILSYVDQVEQHEQERITAIREKILGRFEELRLEPDQSRLEQEMIFYIEKLDINEEKVRLRQHCRYFMDTIDTDPQPGKKLGFIAQEMGREINTTGSKANNTDIQQIVVRMKDELEKIKEQSMNIL